MTIDLELARRIAARHELAGDAIALSGTGMVNEAFRIGEHVLRVVRVAEGDSEAAREVAVAAMVEAAGVRTPALVASDLTCAFAPRPYTIYRWVDGALLGESALDPDAPSLAPTYRALGGELARVARIDVGGAEAPRAIQLYDAQRALARAIAADRITAADAAAVQRWLDELAPRLAPVSPVFVHNDVHPWNVMVDASTGALAAIIDWGNAGVGDPALELIGMPLPALPAMLDGYRAAGGAIDPGMTARLVWGGLALALWEIRELDARVFDRRWWRLSPGGWAEHRARTAALFPELEA